MRLKAAALMMLAVFALSFVLVSAQEVTETPMAESSAGTAATFEDVISSPDTYYGTPITLTGVLEAFLGQDVFVLGDSSGLGNQQMLVINNSGESMDTSLAEGQPITVTGVVRPSVDAVNDDDTLAADFDIREKLQPPVVDTYADFTVLEVTSADDVRAADDSSAEASNEPTTETSLEELTSGTDQFNGQRVSFEGVIESLANVKILVVGEGAVIDNDQVLVVNRTDQEFDLSFSEGERIYVTGIVRPSIQDQMDIAATVGDNGSAIVTPLPAEATLEDDPDAPDVPDINETPATPFLTPQPEVSSVDATEEAPANPVSEIFSLQDLLDPTQLEQYRTYTVVELTSMADLTLVEALGDIIGAPDQYYDRSLMVQGTIETLVSNNAFVLNEGGLLNNNRLLVMSAAGVTEFTEGQNVRVFGTVKPYDAPVLEQDLNLTIDETVFADYQDFTVVVADRIVVVP